MLGKRNKRDKAPTGAEAGGRALGAMGAGTSATLSVTARMPSCFARNDGERFSVVLTPSLRGALATKQSSSFLWLSGLLRFARNDGVRLSAFLSPLAMTG